VRAIGKAPLVRIDRFLRPAAIVLAGVMGLACTLQPVSAEVSLAGGAVVTKGGASGAAVASLGLFTLPAVPLSGSLTVADSGAGFATTFDARLALGPTTIGAGLGFGSLGNTKSTSSVYDAALAERLFEHTSIEARMYFGANRPSSLFAGLRLSF
jgi:hypothetical protein